MKTLNLISILGLIFYSLTTIAEPVFRYDDRASKNPPRPTDTAPSRPAYFDAYKKEQRQQEREKKVEQVKEKVKELNEKTQSSHTQSMESKAPEPIPSAGLSGEQQKQINEELQKLDPETLKKAQDAMKTYQETNNHQ
jgi:hypothetical protein